MVGTGVWSDVKSVFDGRRLGSEMMSLVPPASRPVLVFVFHTAPLSPRRQREEEEDEGGYTTNEHICNWTITAFSAICIVPLRHLLLEQSAEHVGQTLWLLQGAAHKGLLVLAVQHAGDSEGTHGGLPFMAPATFGGRGARMAPQLADEGWWATAKALQEFLFPASHFEAACLALKVVPILLRVDDDLAGKSSLSDELVVPSKEHLCLTSPTGGL